MFKRLERQGEPWLWGCEASRFDAFLKDTARHVILPPEAAGMDNLVERAKLADRT